MIKQTTLIFFLTLITFMALTFFLGETSATEDKFYPPVPDKTKTLRTNDGEPDGCNSSRFKCAMDGAAVLDKQTGLIWARDTIFNNKSLPWQEAVNFCQAFELGDQKGWRLPTREELITLLDTSTSNPAFPDGHPFKIRKGKSHVSGGYWTSTEYESDNKYAWRIGMSTGVVDKSMKIFGSGMWPVLDNN